MQRRERFDGASAPFEGDRTVWLRAIPEGARVTAATLILTPVAGPGRRLFEETIEFASRREAWGATRSTGSVGGLHWVEVDFHTRRTLAKVVGSNLAGAGVQLDLGGVYVQINNRGGILAPGGAPELSLLTDGAVPSLTASRVKLTSAGLAPRVERAVVRSAPSNLLARVGNGLPFWARPGELARPETTPDFATALTEALTTAESEGGYYRIPLVVRSDSIARLDIEVVVDFVIEESVLPGGLAEATLTYDQSGAAAGSAEAAHLTLRVAAGARVVPGAARPRALGAFEKSRVAYGPVGVVASAGVLPLAPGAPLARPLVVPASLTVTSLDLLLAVLTPAASLHVDLLDDADGKPSDEPLLPRPLVVNLDRDLHAEATWVTIALPAAYQVLAGRRYWLVVQSLSGEASWAVATAADGPAMQGSPDASFSWRAAVVPGVAQVEGLVRLRTVPPTFTMPIELEIGAGDRVERVSLARFEALGRVDVDLGVPEVASALNRSLAAASVDRPSGEQLRNATFEMWRRTSDLPTGSRRLASGLVPERVVLAGACQGFVVGRDDNAVQVAHLGISEELVSAPRVIDGDGAGGAIVGVAGDGAGAEAYVAYAGGAVHAIAPKGPAAARRGDLGVPLVGMTASSDGATLYLAVSAPASPTGGAQTPAVNTIVAVPADALGGDLVGMPNVSLGDFVPAGVVTSPDGKALYVLGRSGGLRTIDVARWTLSTAAGAPTPAGSVRPVVTSDGSVLLAIDDEAGALVVVELASGQVSSIAMEAKDAPVAVAASADGRYAFVALRAAGVVAVVDLRSGVVLRRVPVGAQPSDLVLTPDGERLFVADRAGSEGEPMITVVDIGTLVAEDWVVTGGHVRPVCVPSRAGYAVALGAAPGAGAASTAALAQVVAVGRSRYDLAVDASASVDGASAVVAWLGPGHAALGEVTVAIQVGSTSALVAHHTALLAPEGATQAQVSVVTVPGARAVVGRVSFTATANRLVNPTFSLDGVGAVGSWRIRPPDPAGVSAVGRASGLHVANRGPDTVTLAQVADVVPGAVHRLVVDADVVSTTPERPAAALGWLTTSGEPIGPSLRVPFAPGSPSVLAADAAAPAGAASAEVSLVLPSGSTIVMRQVSLESKAMVEVPVRFVAHSPGELTLSGWTVATDLDERPIRPAIPAAALFSPRPPVPLPGEATGAYCATCEGPHATPAGRCGRCGARTPRPPGAAAAAHEGSVLLGRRL